MDKVPEAERRKLGVVPGQLAVRVKTLPPKWLRQGAAPEARRVFKVGDIILAADGQRNLASEGELLAYLGRKSPGQRAHSKAGWPDGLFRQLHLLLSWQAKDEPQLRER